MVEVSKHSLFRLKITVGCLVCGVVALWWCGVLVCCGGVLWWCGWCVCCCVVVVRVCGVWWSLAHSLFLVLSPSSSSQYVSLLSFFFSLLFSFSFSFSFSLAPSLALALALSDDCCHLLFRHCWKVWTRRQTKYQPKVLLKMSSRHGLWLRRSLLMSSRPLLFRSYSMKTSLANDFAVVRL